MEITYLPEDRFVWAQYTGPWTIDELCSTAETLLAHCLVRKQVLLLIDFSRLEPRALTTYDRFKLGTSVSIFTQKLEKVAAAAYAGMIDPERFGEMVARNRGVPVKVFAEIAEAQRWLLEDAG